MNSIVGCTRWDTDERWTSSVNTVRMRVTGSKVFYTLTHSVSAKVKKEIEELDKKQAQGDAVPEGIKLSHRDVILITTKQMKHLCNFRIRIPYLLHPPVDPPWRQYQPMC